MEGVRLVVNKGLSNHFQVSHTVTLSTLGESGYRFGSTYVGSKQTGPAEVPFSNHPTKNVFFLFVPLTPKKGSQGSTAALVLISSSIDDLM